MPARMTRGLLFLLRDDCIRRLESADQQFALVDHLRRQVVVEVDEELLVADDFACARPRGRLLELVECARAENVEAGPVDVLVVGRPADGRFLASARPWTRSTIHLSTRMFSEKPGQRNLPSSSLRNQLTWKMRGVVRADALHLDPVAEVVAHVVAAEGQHGHGVAADLADGAGRRRRWSRSPWWRRCRRRRSS